MGFETLPNFALSPENNLGAMFVSFGLRDYHAAAGYVRRLPYGRNSERSAYRLVLQEGRGTCSTKHALLAALAGEGDCPIELRLGIYEMNELNTPGVGLVLTQYGLDSVPEAHCYLAYRGVRIDLTSVAAGVAGPFVHEETITPDQIGAYKVEVHKRFVRTRAEKSNLGFGQVWRAREECIRALSRADEDRKERDGE